MRILLAIIVAVLLAMSTRAQDHATASGRIEGRVKDGAGAVLPGVQVTLTGVDTGMRQVVTGGDGRFVFDGIRPGGPYAIRGELPGFRSDSERDIAVIGGQTQTINLDLEIGCIDPDLVIQVSDLDELLAADAIVHVRVGDAGEDEHDGCGPSREAVVISAIRFPNARHPPLGETFRLMGARRFARGAEYLLFLSSYGKKHPRAGASSFERPIVGGRIRGASDGDLEIRQGMLVGDALRRLREVRERYRR